MNTYVFVLKNSNLTQSRNRAKELGWGDIYDFLIKPKTKNNMSEHTNTKHKIRRDGDRALEFSGRILGEGSDWTHNSTRWTTVTIYRTAGGKIVVKLHDRTQWQGESDTVRAESFRTVSEAISYLRNSNENYDGDSYLSPEAQSAIESAGESDAEFASAFTENVE